MCLPTLGTLLVSCISYSFPDYFDAIGNTAAAGTSYQIMDFTQSLGPVPDYICILKVCKYITESSWNAQTDELPESINLSLPKKKLECLKKHKERSKNPYEIKRKKGENSRKSEGV